MPRYGGNGADRPEDILRELAERFKAEWPKRLGVGWVVGALVAIWLVTGTYQVDPSQTGVVLRFGRAVATTGPGLHWHIPWPVEMVLKPPTAEIMKEEIGFRTIDPGPPARYRSVNAESLMLTGDGNIVDLDFIVQFKIRDPLAYLFRVRGQRQTLRDCAESAMREVIGKSEIDAALTEGKFKIQEDAQALLQQTLDAYGAGIQVVTVKLQDVGPPEPVSDAFKDVISAQQDKERLINEAEGYRNDVVPRARGRAAQIVNEAEAYQQSRIKNAEGEARRFTQILKEYRKAPEVTRRRLYLEAMEEILPSMEKIVIGGKVSENLLPYLPLRTLKPSPKEKEGKE